jgi:mannose-6-phosphate isomerase-like protein (cupin superfamily)
MNHEAVRSFEVEGLTTTYAHDAPTPIFAKRICEQLTTAPISFVDLVVVPPTAEIGPHTHELDSREVYIVLSGTAEMLLKGETIQVGQGSVLTNEPGQRHSLRNTGDVDVLMVVIDTKADQ